MGSKIACNGFMYLASGLTVSRLFNAYLEWWVPNDSHIQGSSRQQEIVHAQVQPGHGKFWTVDAHVGHLPDLLKVSSLIAKEAWQMSQMN